VLSVDSIIILLVNRLGGGRCHSKQGIGIRIRLRGDYLARLVDMANGKWVEIICQYIQNMFRPSNTYNDYLIHMSKRRMATAHGE
jgi:hypothetical protein